MTLLQLRAYVYYNVSMIELEDCEFDQMHELTEITFGMSTGSLWVGTLYHDYRNVTLLAVSVHEMFRLAET